VLARLRDEHPNLRAALARFEATGAVESLLRLSGALHAFWLQDGHIHDGRHWGERALALGARAPARWRVWPQVGLVATLVNGYGELERARTLVEEAVTLADASGDLLNIALATEWRGIYARNVGQYEMAQEWFAKARAAFAALPEAPWVVGNLTHLDASLGFTAFVQGDLAHAEALVTEALEQQRRWEAQHHTSYAYASGPQSTLGDIARVHGDLAAALAWHQGALRDAIRSEEQQAIPQILSGIAGTLAAAGRWEGAARLFGAAEAFCERVGMAFHPPLFDWQRALGLPEPWLRAGVGFGVADRLRQTVEQVGTSALPPLPDPAAADRLWAAGRLISVETACAEALAIDLATPVVIEEAVSPARLPNAYGLSPREREVLILLCQRLSDAEIGEMLFISPRTASRHVANLFNKLGVSSRREAAALAAHHGLV
jgi:non-specific serine/threonine protein kinase